MKKLFLNLPFVALLIVGVACQNDRSKEQSEAARTEERAENSQDIAKDANDDKFGDNKEVKDDATFVAEQVASNYAELKLAKLGAEKSSVEEIRKVAKMLEAEHQRKLDELQKLADTKSFTIPIEAEKAEIKTVEDLRNEEDQDDFNEEWCEEMVNKHEKTIDLYESKLEDTQDADLKSWISQTLPGLRSHLDQLKACHEKVKDV